MRASRGESASPNEHVYDRIPMLEVRELEVAYGGIRALSGVSLEVRDGEIITLIGANGAGKSTLLRAISGLLTPRKGTVSFLGHSLSGISAHEIVGCGVVHVPEGRHIFADLTVRENLELGAYLRADTTAIAAEIDAMYDRFPQLGARRKLQAGTLSGGEQQMLAIARALMGHPRLLMLDEPSMGLSPRLVREIFALIRQINEEGMTILLVEQNAHMALSIAHRGYVLETGRIILVGPADELAQMPQVQQAYLGEVCPLAEVGEIGTRGREGQGE